MKVYVQLVGNDAADNLFHSVWLDFATAQAAADRANADATHKNLPDHPFNYVIEMEVGHDTQACMEARDAAST